MRIFIVFGILDPCVMSSGLEGGVAERLTGIPPRGLDTGGGSLVNRLFRWSIYEHCLIGLPKCDVLCP